MLIVGTVAFAGSPDYTIVAGPRGLLVGGLGDTGDSFRYNGNGINVGSGSALVKVNDDSNTGFVTGTVVTDLGVLTVVVREFEGTAPFQNGGVARNLYLHGGTGNGPPVLPKVFTYVAGWGKADVYLDGEILYEDYDAHFMVTEGVRDEDTNRVDYRGPKMVKSYPGSIVNPGRQVLHVVAHSEDTKQGNLPPYRIFLHAMWDDISWR
jgi:hypothetical protein